MFPICYLWEIFFSAQEVMQKLKSIPCKYLKLDLYKDNSGLVLVTKNGRTLY